MAQPQLITVDQFKTYRDLGFKVDVDKATEAIREAQQVELYDAFGQFLFDIIENRDAVPFADLMSGSTFLINGDPYIQEGILSLLADYAFARYLGKVSMNLSPFGITTKVGTDSVPVDKKTVDEHIMKTLQDADVKKELIDQYLREYNDTAAFDRYSRGGATTISRTSRRFRIL
tara:strand:+ start:1949 stop:2470 length:522 start_codon:yes stop_codon:yes gene_type:complete